MLNNPLLVVNPPNPEDVDVFATPKPNPVVDDAGVVDTNENPEVDGVGSLVLVVRGAVPNASPQEEDVEEDPNPDELFANVSNPDDDGKTHSKVSGCESPAKSESPKSSSSTLVVVSSVNEKLCGDGVLEVLCLLNMWRFCYVFE